MFGDGVGDIYDYLVETLQHILDAFDSLFTTLKTILDDVIKIVKDIIHGDWKQAWEDAKKLVEDVFKGIWNTIKNIFFAVAALGASIATAIGNTISGIFKTIVNGAIRAIEDILNKPINTINILAGVVNPIIGTVGLHIPTMQTFKLPRLKAGGIINMPRKRNTSWWWISSRRRSRQRRCYTAYRQSSNGNSWRRNWKAYCN